MKTKSAYIIITINFTCHVPININNILAAIWSTNLCICALLNNHLLIRRIKFKLIINAQKIKKVKSYVQKIVRV